LNLTKRELQVLQLLCSGLTHKEIARKLHMSPRYSEWLRSEIGKKTGCGASATRLGVWAAKAGLA
jgi:DNA-binding NarL/FixJ family response regulator